MNTFLTTLYRITFTKALHRIILPLLFIIAGTGARAQSKVFKEVGGDIATEVRAITQDNALVGYLAFTRLEKTDIDSFNYRVTVMDENLNDIGTVNFRQRNLDLQAVAFEGDVLCLGYVESAFAGAVTGKDAHQAYRHGNQQDQILLQFISLDGKVINRYTSPVVLGENQDLVGAFHLRVVRYIKNGIQIRNIPGKGFAAFYGDLNHRELLFLDTRGNLIRKKAVTDDVPGYLLETSASGIYLLIKMHIEAPEGGYKLYTWSATDSVKQWSVELKDRQNNWLKVISFDKDPVTGKAFLAGCVINPDKQEKNFLTAKDYTKNPYLGVFSMTLGATKQDLKTTYSYWANTPIHGIDENGLFTDSSFYAKYATAFRDFSGNTVFVGTGLMVRRVHGVTAFRLSDAVLVDQDSKGHLKLDNDFPCDQTNHFGPGGQLYELDHKGFYKVVNQDTHTNFVIVDDQDNTYIYNFEGRKLMRTIQHKEGHVNTRIFPAKEGHILVSEFNSKDKETRFSIEAL